MRLTLSSRPTTVTASFSMLILFFTIQTLSVPFHLNQFLDPLRQAFNKGLEARSPNPNPELNANPEPAFTTVEKRKPAFTTVQKREPALTTVEKREPALTTVYKREPALTTVEKRQDTTIPYSTVVQRRQDTAIPYSTVQKRQHQARRHRSPLPLRRRRRIR